MVSTNGVSRGEIEEEHCIEEEQWFQQMEI